MTLCDTDPMYFRLTYEIMGYNIPLRDDPLTIDVDTPHDISIEITYAHVDSEAKDEAVDLIRVVANVSPPPKATIAIRDLSQGSDQPARFNKVSNPLEAFSEKIYRELADVATTTFALLRWRFAMDGPVRPFKARGIEWSEDKISWHNLPYKTTFRIKASVQKRLREEDCAELESLVSSKTTEPLAHFLLREARASATVTGSYSSALVMAIAALEIGVKHLIAELIPDAGWLVLQLPTPPIARIIKDYLSTLPARQVLDGKAIVPPDNLIETINKGVTARNAASHAGLPLPDQEFVERVLNAVSDMLWILDYYTGRRWALDHLSAETRTALGGLCKTRLLSGIFAGQGLEEREFCITLSVLVIPMMESRLT